jgi:hypothetical protein
MCRRLAKPATVTLFWLFLSLRYSTHVALADLDGFLVGPS